MGWYRIVNELKAEGVRTICVFDGKERNAAKAREVSDLVPLEIIQNTDAFEARPNAESRLRN